MLRTLVGLGAFAMLLVWLTGSGGGIAGPSRPPQPTVRVTLAPSTFVGGTDSTTARSALPWPPTGESAVYVPAVGYRAQSGPERPVPVASMTKIMTAYVVLEDHPLAPGQQGPRVEITPADVSQFDVDTVTDQANVELKRGEVLTEHQMLMGLLVHSANDLAYALARWDAGTLGAFVAKMNATAAALGMRHTHFADASGFSPSSRSTAADLLDVAAAAMTDPAFAQIVGMTSATLPVAGTVESYTPLVGSTGVVGVKSGFTTAAGGGDVLAYRATVDGHAFLSLAAVTSQESWTVLEAAGKEALALARTAAAGMRSETVAPEGTVVAEVETGSRPVELTTSAAASVLATRGTLVRQRVRVQIPPAGAKKGAEVGTATFVVADQRVSVPVRAAARVA